jgi:plasmid maintenance system killer protein
MYFQIDTAFFDSLARLTGEEQKAAKIAALDLQISLQMNRALPGLQFHRLEKVKARDLWSARVNDDLRLIMHYVKPRLLFCYIDHEEGAYDWASRRKKIAVPDYVEGERSALPKSPLFSHIADAELLSFGVPSQRLRDVRRITDEDDLFKIYLPDEVALALVDLVSVAKPNPVEVARSALSECDWVYFATFPPVNFDETRNFMRKFRIIVRTAFNSAGNPVAHVKHIRPGHTILLVHGGGPSKKPYRPVCSCTVATPPPPRLVSGFDALSFANESQQRSLRNSGYTPDPQLNKFTLIPVKEYQDLEHFTCSIPRPSGTHTIRPWKEVFPSLP